MHNNGSQHTDIIQTHKYKCHNYKYKTNKHINMIMIGDIVGEYVGISVGLSVVISVVASVGEYFGIVQ